MITQTKNTVTSGVEVVLDNCKMALETNLKWLQEAFGRAWLLPRGGQLERIPQVFTKKGDYESVLPNDKYTAFSFFIGIEAAVPTEETEAYVRSLYFQKSFDLIFYMNLKKIDPSQDYYFVEQLNQDILRVLSGCQGIQIQEIWMEDIREVYAGMDLTEITNALLYYPHSGIRYRLFVTYKENC